MKEDIVHLFSTCISWFIMFLSRIFIENALYICIDPNKCINSTIQISPIRPLLKAKLPGIDRMKQNIETRNIKETKSHIQFEKSHAHKNKS